MDRHKFNIFPEARPEDFQRLKQDIADNGYDDRQPIVLYQGGILDGWNRQKACNELGIEAKYETFEGTDEEAIAYMMRTNKRRNLNSGQWSCIAVEAEELVAAIRQAVEKERLAKQKANASNQHKEPLGKKLPKPKKTDELKTAHKTAELFNTNRTYVNQANKLKTEAPEVFEKVKSGTIKMNDAIKSVKAEERKKAVEQIEAVTPKKEKKAASVGDVWQLGNHTLFVGDTSSDEFRRLIPDCHLAFADPPYGAGKEGYDDSKFYWEHDYLADRADVVVVTPGIVSIFEFARKTDMPYVWSIACWISNGMTRGAIGFGNWIYGAVFSHGSVFRQKQDFCKATISVSETEDTTHTTRKPTEFMAYIIETFTRKSDVVVDPFLGSGQTLLACEQMERTCYGGELDPRFCEEIIARWEAMTGKEAVKK